MGATDVYQLPWPELGDLADAPDGYQDLAQATEAALLKEKNADSTLPWTPTFVSNGAQPSGIAWTCRYEVRNGWCEVQIFGQISAATNGGTGILTVGLPVRSRAMPEQALSAKLYCGQVGWPFSGHAYIGGNSLVCNPSFPTRDNSSVCSNWSNGNGQPGNAAMVPQIPGGYACGGSGNIQIWGRYLV